MRAIAIIVMVLGVASLALGILFIIQASSAENEIAAEIQPVKIAEVDGKYDAVKTKQMALAATEEPQIQAGKAAPSAMYNYLSGQRTSLGLARANIGTASFVRTSGIVELIIGVGLVLAGLGLLRKAGT
jgi:hypothetical protein